jgi:hypothetical protein
VTEAIVLLIALALVVALSVWYASGLLKALLDVSSMLVDSHHLIDRVHEREIKHRTDLLNRLMARDYDHYQTYALAESEPTESDEVSDEELRRERPWIPGPAQPEETPPEILEELEELERSQR